MKTMSTADRPCTMRPGPPTSPPRMSTLAVDAVLIGSGTRAHLHVHASVKA
jgi:hypothetical protein